MNRSIVSNVGISSLVNRSLVDFYTANLVRLQDDLRSNRERADALGLCLPDLKRGLQRIWDKNYSPHPRRRREDSPAEVAALSLLQVEPDDRIVLLHSDTAGGRFCTRLVEAALQIENIPNGLDYPRCQKHQLVSLPVTGLMLTDDLQSVSYDPDNLSQTFMRDGIGSYVTLLCDEYRRLRDNGGGTLILNVTSGYRGVLPAARDAALLLAADARTCGVPITVRMCCLFQSADALVWLDPLPLSVAWNDLPPVELLTAASMPAGAPADSIAPEHAAYFDAHETNPEQRRLSPLGAIAHALQHAIG